MRMGSGLVFKDIQSLGLGGKISTAKQSARFRTWGYRGHGGCVHSRGRGEWACHGQRDRER
jgi:hypothetical protein